MFQSQRDLALARNVELQNVLNFHRSVIDLETVQEAPLQGAGTLQAAGTLQGAGGGGGGTQTATVR